MVQFKSIFGILVIIVILISGCLTSKPQTIDYQKTYTLILSSEEENLVGMWESQSGATAFIFNANRSGSWIGKDNGSVVGSYDFKWRILKYHPSTGDTIIDPAASDEILILQTFNSDGSLHTSVSYSFYLINKGGSNPDLYNILGRDMFILKQYTGSDIKVPNFNNTLIKDVNFHRIKN